MMTPLKVCTNCGVENAMERSSCASCGSVFTQDEPERETTLAPFPLEENHIPLRRRARLTRRRVLGLGGAALLAAIGTPFLVSAVAAHRQEMTIVEISPEHSFLAGLAWSTDGKKVAACDDTGIMHIWAIANPLIISRSVLSVNVAAQGIVQSFTIPGQQGIPIVNALAWSPDGKYLAIASDLASIMDATAGTLVRMLQPSKGDGDIVQIAWSPDGQYLATAKANRTNDKGNIHIYLWATNGWSETQQLPGAYDAISSMVWSVQGNRLLVAGDISTSPTLQSNVQIWDGETATPLLLQKAEYTGGTSGAAWSPDGNFFVVGTGEKNRSVLRVYTTAGTFHSTYASSDQSSLVAMVWSPSNHIEAVFGPSANDASMAIYQWNAANGQLLSTSTAAETAEQGGWDQYNFVWSPDGTQVAYTEVSSLAIWRPGWSFPSFDE